MSTDKISLVKEQKISTGVYNRDSKLSLVKEVPRTEHVCVHASSESLERQGFTKVRSKEITINNKKARQLLFFNSNNEAKLQATKFPVDSFSESEARSWCKEKGGSFEKAKQEEESQHQGDCPPGRHKVNGECIPNKSAEQILCLGDCSGIKQESVDEMVHRKIAEAKQAGKLIEQVNWKTWVQPTEQQGLIEGEALHVTVSGNGVDYTKEELLPAVNTMIGKPIFKVPVDEATMPDDLHNDPAKKIVGEMKLAKWANETINYLGQVDNETFAEMQQGMWPQGSIEAKFAFKGESDKRSALFEPEFLQFTGYLLLPPGAPPGDTRTTNQVFEQWGKKYGVCCLNSMCETKQRPRIIV